MSGRYPDHKPPPTKKTRTTSEIYIYIYLGVYAHTGSFKILVYHHEITVFIYF